MKNNEKFKGSLFYIFSPFLMIIFYQNFFFDPAHSGYVYFELEFSIFNTYNFSNYSTRLSVSISIATMLILLCGTNVSSFDARAWSVKRSQLCHVAAEAWRLDIAVTCGHHTPPLSSFSFLPPQLLSSSSFPLDIYFYNLFQ